MAFMKLGVRVLSAGIALSAMSNVAFAQQCTPAHKFSTIVPGVLSVATFPYPPFSVPAGEDVGGIDAEILKKIAAKECLKLSFSVVDPSAVIQSVVSGKADVAMGDWQRTAARAKVLGLSAPIYVEQVGFISKDGIDSVAGLQGKRVGSVQGYFWTGDLQKLLGGSLAVYPNPVAMAQDLEAGRLDVGTDAYSVVEYDKKKGGYKGLQVKVVKPDPKLAASRMPSQAGFPYTKGNDALGKALSADIDELHKSGEMVKILKTNGVPPSAGDVGEPRLME